MNLGKTVFDYEKFKRDDIVLKTLTFDEVMNRAKKMGHKAEVFGDRDLILISNLRGAGFLRSISKKMIDQLGNTIIVKILNEKMLRKVLLISEKHAQDILNRYSYVDKDGALWSAEWIKLTVGRANQLDEELFEI